MAPPGAAAPAGVTPAAPAAVPLIGNPRVARLRNQMLGLISAAIAFAVLTGIIAWQANARTYDAYHTLVDEGSVSVDAALQARAAVVDQMGAAATYLATTGPAQQAAADRATARWNDFIAQSRISWRNLSDRTQGEQNVSAAADSAASDYIQRIGAMYAYNSAKQPDQAGTAFLSARDILNNRLVPALGGLEAVKVEDMEAIYANASDRITTGRLTLVGIATLLGLVLLLGLLAVRRMHYAWSWPLGLALLLTIGVTALMQAQLASASSDARVMVRDAYDTVAGVQDMGALLSQARALESIAIFDNTHAATHLAGFDQYNFLVEQLLCGDKDCTQVNSFLRGADTIDPQVAKTAVDAQRKFGLPRAPLIANVHFRNQAAQYETLRQDYRHWLDLHGQLATQLKANQVGAASALSTGASDQAFAKVVADADAVRSTTRTQYDSIWQRVYTTSSLAQVLALAFPGAGLLAAWGIWRRRSELFV